MSINITNITNSETFSDFIANVNNSTNQVIGIMILISLFFILYFGFLKYGSRIALQSAALISGLIGIVFWSIHFIPSAFGIFFIIMFVGAILGFFMP